MNPDSTFIIAEAGVNHNGSLEQALALVDIAAAAGADAVKFQTFQASKLATSAAGKAAYQVRNTESEGDQVSMLKALELSHDDHRALLARCRDKRIHFMSTAFDEESLSFLGSLDMPAVKVPSGDITCAPLLLQVSRMGKPIILSTGMSNLADIEAALGVLAFGLVQDGQPRSRSDFASAYATSAGRDALQQHVTLLHCVSQYPAPAQAVNLRAMDAMRAAFGLRVGYSDHTLGVEVALAAVARGACVIEKHFTLDRRLPGPDHAASLEPAELASMVAGIRTIESCLGDGIKRPAKDEVPNIPLGRRSLVAARRLCKGEILQAQDVAYKRPAVGLSPMAYWDVLGRPVPSDTDTDEPLKS